MYANNLENYLDFQGFVPIPSRFAGAESPSMLTPTELEQMKKKETGTKIIRGYYAIPPLPKGLEKMSERDGNRALSGKIHRIKIVRLGDEYIGDQMSREKSSLRVFADSPNQVMVCVSSNVINDDEVPGLSKVLASYESVHDFDLIGFSPSRTAGEVQRGIIALQANTSPKY